MCLRSIASLFLFSATTATLHAQAPAVADSAPSPSVSAENPAKSALEAFKEGRYAKAIELAGPLADRGNGEALYLLGAATETGKGLSQSREQALIYYRKAITAKNKDAAYRLGIILLGSEKEEERKEALEVLETVAKEDPSVAGSILGEAYLGGRIGSAPDPDKALIWWKRAADKGDISSTMAIARFYDGQLGFPELKSTKEALAYYSKAAAAGDVSAMTAVGSRLLSGDEKLRDEAKGREWLKKAIAAKDYTSYLVLGDFEENIKKNLKAALTEYERGKDAGQADCTLRAADFYTLGKGVEKDEARGISLMEKASEGGSATASYRIALKALAGEKPDLFRGYKYLVTAANGNSAEAQNELGIFYLSGKLPAVDGPAGVAWLTRAAQAGYAQAQNNLATLFERGTAGVPQNMQNAAQLYLLAANQGNGPATLALARILADGVGTKPDFVKAWCFASLAQERGVDDAKKYVEAIAAKLDPQQMTEAKKQLEDIKSGKRPTAKPAEEPKKAK
jgi:uncharacterized protein